MGITDAINCHERILELKENFSLEVLANGSINPTYRTVQIWHNEWRLENLGPRSGSGLIEVIFCNFIHISLVFNNLRE